jgi:lantibiotic modifying enzyme
MAESVPGAPGDPRVIAAEVADLLTGDVPFFATTPARGRLSGPAGTEWLPEKDLAAEAIARWRSADPELDLHVVRSALAAAYLNEGWMPGEDRMPPGRISVAGLDRRRRTLAAELLRRIRDTAIRADDGSVTWIAPVLGETGWSVQPLALDVYGGLPGVAVVLAAYLRQTAAGEADGVSGLGDLLEAVLQTLRRTEDAAFLNDTDPERRPATPGGYVGLSSQIWVWQRLWHLGAVSDGLDRARALAAVLPSSVSADMPCELLTGMAGAIVPLLDLARATGEARWLGQAREIGDILVAAARWLDDAAYWPSDRYPHGLGGFAHGVTGIGWALARLALASVADIDDRPSHRNLHAERYANTARAAFAFDEALYDEATAGWLDKRDPGRNAAAWCHGAVGIGIAAADLARRGWPVPEDLLSRAASATDRQGFGWNHTPCHGDTGAWEVLDAALAAGCAPAHLDGSGLQARIIGSLEANGTITGLSRAVFSPGLLAGAGGVAYQLLRMSPGCDLPSLLLQGTYPEH